MASAKQNETSVGHPLAEEKGHVGAGETFGAKDHHASLNNEKFYST